MDGVSTKTVTTFSKDHGEIGQMCKSVVIADDEAITRLDIKERLELAGYKVAGEAADGFDTIEICRKQRPDMVLLDVKMPMLDGLSAARVIKEEGLSHCVIMLTAYSDSDFVKKAGELGVMGYLVKPVTDKALVPTIEVALKRSQEIQLLQKENKAKDRQLKDRMFIDRAKGIVMSTRNMSEDEAYKYMRNISMDKRKSMRVVAEMIIMSHQSMNAAQKEQKVRKK